MDGVRILVARGMPTNEELVRLIEVRRKTLQPHFSSFTLPKLGDFECLSNESWRHGMKRDGPLCVGDSRFSLNTQGIFGYGFHEIDSRESTVQWLQPTGGRVCLWGLTRENEWIIAIVSYKAEAGYKDRGYDRATEVTFLETDLPGVLSAARVKPFAITEALENMVESWRASSARRLGQAEDLIAGFTLENAVIRVRGEKA